MRRQRTEQEALERDAMPAPLLSALLPSWLIQKMELGQKVQQEHLRLQMIEKVLEEGRRMRKKKRRKRMKRRRRKLKGAGVSERVEGEA
jgi:hypothetical protein